MELTNLSQKEQPDSKKRKLTVEDIDKVRHIEGFPIAEDEDIIALSAPPYYTACPNPFLQEFIEQHGKPYDPETDDYHREPFAADVSEGKNDPIYNAHSYHTKVPHKAVMRYILHYTDPGDIVYDGFCGTGMTGVAAQMCGNPDLEFKFQIEKEMPGVKWGARKAILCDLSPAATFIAYNYNTTVDVEAFEQEAKRILKEVEAECGWMYETNHVLEGGGKSTKGKINYTVWSDVFICSECAEEIVFWDAAVDHEAGKVLKTFQCPHCNASLTKRKIDRATETVFDDALNTTITRAKQVPVLINYSVEEGGKTKRYKKTPDAVDLALIEKIESTPIPYWFPTNPMMDKGGRWGDTWRAGIHFGITHVHHFYTRRNLWLLAKLWDSFAHSSLFHQSAFSFTAMLGRATKMYRWNAARPTGTLSGTLYVPSLWYEFNLSQMYRRRTNTTLKAIGLSRIFSQESIKISTKSSTNLSGILENSIDYCFTDPPFGSNLMYSELNFLWEAWLRVKTNNKSEAIENKTQGKSLIDYQRLMEGCFRENYRILKPGRWMTVEFHNSKNSVWSAIQEAILRAGFVVADVRILDKKQGSFKQYTTTSAVKQDLIISAYKPRDDFERQFEIEAGTEEGVWSFVRQHLEKLPVVVHEKGVIQVIAERQAFLLFSRMVAFHIQRDAKVPMSSPEFYRGLDEKFIERDGMYFLPTQAAEYDKVRAKTSNVQQLELFVTDEQSAVQWLRSQLEKQPQTYQELHPNFLRELQKAKHEELPELRTMLEENFLCDEEGCWYVPDPDSQEDLEKLRSRRLWDEFQEYAQGKGKLRMFRTEAIRAGFKRCYAEQQWSVIVDIGDRMPQDVLYEDQDLLMYYDIATTRLEEEPIQGEFL